MKQFEVVYLDETHMDDILALQEKVIPLLADPEFLQPLSKEEFTAILRSDKLMAGIFEKGRLIAFRAMCDPGNDEEHLGLDIGLAEDELPSVLYSEISAVDPEFRGNGLQTYLGNWLMARMDGRWRYMCTTVAPLNIPSLKDKFALGMKIGGLKRKYGGKLRYILYKPLQGDGFAKTAEMQAVEMADIDAQKKLLAEGWIGGGMEQRGEVWFTLYAK